MLNLPATTSVDQIVKLAGGLDLLTPTLSLKDGYAREMRNFECSITGGYSRIAGYERHDGRPNPSDATFLSITCNITGSIVVGDTLYGVTSTATAKVIYVNGSLVVYTKAVGAFEVGESVKTPDAAGAVQATITALGGGEDGADFDARMLALAADVYRADIAAIPGSGRVRGVVYFGGVLYGFRDNALATAKRIYKATSSGWTLLASPNLLTFNTGSNDYVAGGTVTQGGASAVVKRVCLVSGSWTGGDAAGYLIIGAVTGGPFAAGAAAGSGVATLAGAETAVTLPAGGVMEFDIGTVDAKPLVYFVDGIGRAFEFDGDYIAPIITGNAVDVPTHVMVHANHLHLSFGNSRQNGGVGTPFDWRAISGASENLADGTITGMKRLAGDQSTGVAAITYDTGTHLLYGLTEANFRLGTFEDSAGAKPGTLQRLGQLYALDDRGVVATRAAQEFGNFASNTLTLNIRPWIQARRNLVTASLVNREKNQYRLFFSDGAGLYITLANGKMLGCGPVQFPEPVWCSCTGETPDGAETAFFGSDDGWVYRLDAGTSFDGGEIDYEFFTVYSNQGAPRTNKRFRRATFEIQSDFYATFRTTFDLAYGSTERVQQTNPNTVQAALSSGHWDEFTWDAFTYDGRTLAPEVVDIEGSGENIGIRVAGSSAICQPFTINSVILTFSPRRRKRS